MTIYTLMVQCWLGTWGWWRVINGARPCVPYFQIWSCCVLLEHASRVGILSQAQLNLTTIASLLPVSLWPANIYLHSVEVLAKETRDASIRHLYSCNIGGRLGDVFQISFKACPKYPLFSSAL